MANLVGEYIAELDRKQDECYRNFLARMGMEHTESLWEAFIDVWVTAMYLGTNIADDFPLI